MLQKQIEKKHVAKNHQCYTVVMILVPESSPLHLREPATVSGHRYIPTPYETFVARNPNAMFLHVLCFFQNCTTMEYKGGKMFEKDNIVEQSWPWNIVVNRWRKATEERGKFLKNKSWYKRDHQKYWKAMEAGEEIWRKKVVRRLFYLKYCMIMTINFYWLRATEGNCWKMTSCGTIIAQYHIAEARPAQSVCASSALGQF